MAKPSRKAPATHQYQVTSISSYLALACRLRDEWIEGTDYFDPWFRGQHDAAWALQPNIFRYDLLNEEDEIRAEFQRRAPQYMPEAAPTEPWGWYFLMQHYGAPTRLLDWTDSALAALYFAICSSRPDEHTDNVDAAVWVLDPWWLNRSTIGLDSILLYDFPDSKKYLALPYSRSVSAALPAAIDPPYLVRRLAAQHSHFTIFGHDSNGLQKVGSRSDTRLVRITIPSPHIERMRVDLVTAGITDSTIYPDLKGLSDELIRSKTGNWPV